MSATPAEFPPLREEAAPDRAASSGEEATQSSHTARLLASMVTKYASAEDNKGVGPRTIQQCVNFIKSDKAHCARILALRPLYAEAERLRLLYLAAREAQGHLSGKELDEATKTERAAYLAAKALYDEGKKRLPAITLSGTFSHRAIVGLETYSGLLQADFDHLAAKHVSLQWLRARAEHDPHVLFVTESPSGDGLKLIFPVESGPEEHAAAFPAMQRYCEKTYGIRPDDACKDVSRMCFLPSDPLVQVNANVRPLDWREWVEPVNPATAARDTRDDHEHAIGSKPDKTAVRSMLAVIPKRPDYPEWLKIVAAVGDALNGDDAAGLLNEWSPEERPGEYLAKLQSGMEQVHVGTLIHLAKGHGWQPGEPWPDVEPLPPEHPPVALFDYDLLPSAFAAYARDVAERMQCPPDYVAVGLMCSVGNLVGRKVAIHPKRKDDWLEVCNLWGAVVGPPSIMKSPALSDAMLPLNKLVAEAIERHKAACAEFADAKEVRVAGKEMRKTALAKTLKERGEAAALDLAKEQRTETKDEPICERFTANDVTTEKLGMMLNENPNGLLQFRDELAGWLRSMDKDGHENDRAFFLECWNGKGSYTSDRVERGTTHVEAAIVGVLGGIQPGVLSKYIREATGSGSGSDGLLQRFNLIVWPEITPLFVNIDRYPNKEAKEAVMDVFRRLHAMTSADLDATTDYSTIPALRFTHEAQDRFDQWRERFENGLRSSDEHPALVAHLTKHRKAVPVLALLDHLCDGDTGAVGLKSLEKAIRWHEYLKSHAAKVYGGIRNGGAAPAREILRRINEGDIKDGFTARDVYRRELAGLDDRATVESGINALLAANYLREDITTTAGKSIVRHRIHPSLYPSGAQGNQPPLLPKGGSSPEKGAFGSNGSEVSKAPEGEKEEL